MCWKSAIRNLVAVLLLLGLRAGAQEDFVLRSEAGGSDTDVVKLAILPFAGTSGFTAFAHQALPEAVIRADLLYSGRFDVSDLSDTGARAVAASGAAMVIQGHVKLAGGGELEIHYQLLDATSRQTLLEKTYSGGSRELRRLSHRFSDDVVFQLFGERGIACTRIAYAYGKPGHKEIWAMDYDGFNAAPLTKNGSINIAPSYDREGNIVWISFQGGEGARAWKRSPSGKAQVLCPSLGGTHSAVTVSPSDGEVAIASSASGQSQIYRANPSGSNPVRLTYGDDIQTSPSWSPTGREIVFSSDRTGMPQLYIMDREGSSMRRLTYRGLYNDQAAWSPNGNLIAYGRLASDWRVVVIRPDGTGDHIIANGRNPKWSPDGRHLVYMSEWGGSTDIWTCNADGSDRRQLTHSGKASLPTWSP